MIGVQTLAVSLSSHQPKARPVAVALTLHYEMQCGWPGPGSLTIRFPAAMAVPARIAPTSVLVDHKAPSAVTVSSGDTVTVALPPRPQIMCDVIGPGTLTVSFSRAARLGNPKAAGSYLVRATRPSVSASGRIVIAA
jgi:hypothetical protein